jgi:hypothetical protein
MTQHRGKHGKEASNPFREWHKAASVYDEFLHQRVRSALALQIAGLSETALRHLPTRGLITCVPELASNGHFDSPALSVWVRGFKDEELDDARDEWYVDEIEPFEGIDQFLSFERDFLDLEVTRPYMWDHLSHNERVIAAISFLGLLKPASGMFVASHEKRRGR